MNIPAKKLILIITAMLSCMAFTASCSKEPDVTTGKAGKKAPVTGKAKSIPIDEKNTLNAVRHGQLVSLNWRVAGDAGKFKQIEVMRSSTGKKSQQTKVAVLKPDATSHQDRLPDERPWWYSIRVLMADGSNQIMGPVRVDSDMAGSANYVKPENQYTTNVTRTDDFTTLKWSFPEGDCAEVRIIRSTRPLSEPFRKPRYKTDVATTVEANSQYVDTLPDPNADYWYWFRVTLKSGTIVDKGPIKAEYSARPLQEGASGK